jgi:hypothetical protein
VKIDRDRRIGEYLAGLADGRISPMSPNQAIRWAGEATRRGRHALAARLYRDAINAVPSPAAYDNRRFDRYLTDAARAAALAGTGQGIDPPVSSDRPALRQLALDWLTADLVAHKVSLTSEPGVDRSAVHESIQRLLREPAFAGVRHPIAVYYLPPGERDSWRAFWADARRVEAKTAPPQAAPPPAR